MLHRQAEQTLRALRTESVVVEVTGPRQSGKSTLVKAVCDDLPYLNLESPIERANYGNGREGELLVRFPNGAILDEIQHLPEFTSHLQVWVDRQPRHHPGRWILTGSQLLTTGRTTIQSLAGRVSRLELLPLSFHEVRTSSRVPPTLAAAVLRGGYPALYDDARSDTPTAWLENYFDSLIHRDVRDLIHLRNQHEFEHFVRLLAARTATTLNASAIAGEVGVSAKTIGEWLNVLEACYVIRRVQPYHRNFGKRLVRKPKTWFLDSGLACALLGLRDVNQLVLSPAYSRLTATWYFSEIIKALANRNRSCGVHFWRSSDGIDIDLLLDLGSLLLPAAFGSSAPDPENRADRLQKLRTLSARDRSGPEVAPGFRIHGGEESSPSTDPRCIPWREIESLVDGFP